jgi:hypothetical protein
LQDPQAGIYPLKTLVRRASVAGTEEILGRGALSYLGCGLPSGGYRNRNECVSDTIMGNMNMKMGRNFIDNKLLISM